MRLKKCFAMISTALILCGALQTDVFAEKANRSQFTTPSTASEHARQVMPDTPPANSNYSSYTPSANTATSAGTGIKIGSKSYKSLQAAVNSVKNGQTIHVTKNIVLSKAVGCHRDISFKIDFHNHKLKMPREDSAFYITEGNVSLKGMKLIGWSEYKSIIIEPESSVTILSGKYNGQIGVGGTLTVKGGELAGEQNYCTIFNDRDGKVNIQDGTIRNKGPYSSVIYNMGTLNISGGIISQIHEDDGGVYYAAIDNGGAMFITGGVINGSPNVITIGNGQLEDAKGFVGTGRCIISGGTINGEVCTYGGARTNIIKGGVIKTKEVAVSCFGGTVVIDGGNITSTTDCCVYVVEGTATINGGTLKGEQHDGGYVAACRGGTLNIQGGSFIGSKPWVYEYEAGAISLGDSANDVAIIK